MKLFWIVGVPSPKPQDLYLPITEVEILRVLWLVKMSLKKLGKTNWMGQLTDPRGFSLIWHISIFRPKRVWILRRVGLKTDIDFARLGLETGIVFETVVYERFCRFNSKWIRKKEICALAFLFKEWRHNFSEVGAENRCENGIFWSEIRSGFGEPGGTPPPGENFQESPHPFRDWHCVALYFCRSSILRMGVL